MSMILLAKLLVTCGLRPSESWTFLLARLSLENYGGAYQISTIKGAAFSAKMRIEQPQTLETYHYLSQLTAVEIPSMYEATIHRFAKQLIPPSQTVDYVDLGLNDLRPILTNDAILRNHVRSSNQVQYCPICYQNSAYHQTGWSLKAITVCLKHKARLVSCCVSCKQPISIIGLSGGYCLHCLTDYREMDGTRANDQMVLNAQVILYRWFQLGLPRDLHSLGDQLARKLPNESASALYNVINGLSRAFLPFFRDLGDNVVETQKRKVSPHLLYTQAIDVLLDWPNRFFGILDQYKARNGREITGKLNEDFGRIYTVWLERNWRHPAFTFIQDAFNQYISSRYVLNSSIIHSRRYEEDSNFRQHFPHITTAEAAEILSVAPETIYRLVQLKILPVDPSLGHDDARQGIVKPILRRDVASLYQTWQSGVSLAHSVEITGLSEKIVLQLGQLGLLHVIRGETADGSAHWLFDLSSLKELQKRLRENCHDSHAEMVHWIAASQKLSPYQIRGAMIFQAVLKQELVGFVSEEAPIGELHITNQSLDQLLAQQQVNRESYSITYLARRNKLKPTTLQGWIDAGLLNVADDCPRIYMDEWERFRNDCLFAHEAAKILGIGVLAVQKWARNGRLHPLSGPHIDGLHRYLFCRKEIECFRPEMRLTAPQMAKLLGLSRSQLIQWIKQGKVSPVSGPGIDKCGQYLFLRNRENM